MTRITEQIARLRKRIEIAADRSGRDPRDIRIVAISKKHPAAAIREAQAAGLSRFGENYIQEALAKIALIEPPVEWHFVGKIQFNKAAPLAERFDWVHTISSERIARRLSAKRPREAGDLCACIQIRPMGNTQRNGVDPAEVPTLAALIEELPGLRLRGLMIMPPPGLSTDAIRREFARTRTLLHKLNAAGHSLDTLSMGMSADLEAAIMEGSTLLRVGTDIFGARAHD